MESKSIAFGIVEAVIGYFFLWYFLNTMKKERNLGLPDLGFVTCPWIREREAWKQL